MARFGVHAETAIRSQIHRHAMPDGSDQGEPAVKRNPPPWRRQRSVTCCSRERGPGRLLPHASGSPPVADFSPLGMTSDSADRSRADTCFAMAEQASEEASPSCLGLVRSRRFEWPSGDARTWRVMQERVRAATAPESVMRRSRCNSSATHRVAFLSRGEANEVCSPRRAVRGVRVSGIRARSGLACA
jgi:hypothetical protein